MKKIIIAAIAVLGFTTANAQYTAEKGDFQTSIDFRPFKSSGDMFSNEVGNTVGVNFSYFLADKHALRLGLGFDTNSTKDASSDGKFGVNLGYEYHFKSYERVDLFAGAQVGFATAWGKTKQQTYNNAGEPNGTVDVKAAGLPREFSVGVFTGVNYYFYKKLYVGAEVQLGYAHTSYSKGQSYDGEKVIDNKEAAPGKNKIGFNVLPAFRLGWTF